MQLFAAGPEIAFGRALVIGELHGVRPYHYAALAETEAVDGNTSFCISWESTPQLSGTQTMKLLGLLFAFVLLAIALPAAQAADPSAVLNDLEADRPSWLFPADACPADVMSERDVNVAYLGDRCIGALSMCIARCRREDANACYALALAVQSLKRDALSEALFLRACKLGVVSGCTNRAAGMMNQDQACSIRSFEKTCNLDDPWGCTMFGYYLVRGDGIVKDHQRARAVLSKSCRFGDEDEACRWAKGILKEVDENE